MRIARVGGIGVAGSNGPNEKRVGDACVAKTALCLVQTGKHMRRNTGRCVTPAVECICVQQKRKIVYVIGFSAELEGWK
jgi:hypothetical protein